MSADDDLPIGGLRVTLDRKETCRCVGTEYEGECDGDGEADHNCGRDCGWCDGDLWVWSEIDTEVVGYIVCTSSGAPASGRFADLDEAISDARIMATIGGRGAPFQVCAMVPVSRQKEDPS